MRIELERQNDAFHMQATNESGNQISMDGSPAIGGSNLGPRPMEMLLMGLGGCSAIDVISILRKQKADPGRFWITIEGEREADVTPSLFRKIHVHFRFKGALASDQISRAIELSMGKYCSVAKTLEKTAEITYDFSVEN